ncbi:Uncharacterised protein [Mycobacteroides abscessus subsp. abscessus]|uniref:hypothetical protein n=1 Tax=Mycobacteroides abscessus TaxID=36809 RepID=UPI00092CCA57|nr:hypothetical protein [Mycobacteroides abscessus]SIE47945.1 Uncharacterised protein [Mycobacteroides abscessus subsp. abscessus]
MKYAIAIVGAAAALVLVTAPAASAGNEIPVAWAVAPGVGLAAYDTTGHPVEACTVGFLAHDITGQQFMLSATIARLFLTAIAIAACFARSRIFAASAVQILVAGANS